MDEYELICTDGFLQGATAPWSDTLCARITVEVPTIKKVWRFAWNQDSYNAATADTAPTPDNHVGLAKMLGRATQATTTARKLLLLGYSWGGAMSAHLADELVGVRDIAEVLFIDPVQWGLKNIIPAPFALPVNVKKAFCVKRTGWTEFIYPVSVPIGSCAGGAFLNFTAEADHMTLPTLPNVQDMIISEMQVTTKCLPQPTMF